MKLFLFVLLLFSLVLSACGSPSVEQITPEVNPTDTPEEAVRPTATATVKPLKTFTVCTSSLPSGLFPYDGIRTPIKANLLSMIYEEPIIRVGDELRPIILERVPSQSLGDLRLEPSIVRAGQTVVDARGELVVLKSGVQVRPSGCRQEDCAITWDGETPLEMDQMVLDFHINEDLTWSDGTPVTAQDSTFSYRLSSAPEAPGIKWAEDRTAAYFEDGEKTVRWVGKPGFTTAQIERFFWVPLPSHLFNENTGWAELSEAEPLKTSPLSYGPFVLTSWDEKALKFTPNPFYARSEQGDLVVDEIIFRTLEGGVDSAWAGIQSGDCDMLDGSFGLENHPDVLEAIRNDEGFFMLEQTSTAWTQLVFGIQPAAYDNLFAEDFDDRPDIFGDPLTRQAFASCLDREAMLTATLNGLGAVWPSFLPPNLSQIEEGAGIIYDPALGLQYLEQAGWRDHDEDPSTPLQAWSVPNVPAGTLFLVELLIDQSGFHRDLAANVQESLGECGIGVDVRALSPAELYAPGPEGPLFGRRFDLALISWQPKPDLDCGFYYSWEVPADQNQWIGVNIAGLSDIAYDNACSSAGLTLPQENRASLIAAEETFLTSLPAVPFFSPTRVLVLPGVGCNQDSAFADISFSALIELAAGEKDCP